MEGVLASESPSTGSEVRPRHLEVIDRGREPFEKSLDFQLGYAARKAADRAMSDAVVMVEHDHVYTAGRGVPFEKPIGFAATVPWFETNRGGQITYHGPGQLVAYPIFDLEHHGRDVHLYLRKLEQVVISTLAQLGIAAFQREGLTGVWVPDLEQGPKKIASCGIGVSRWVSYHGVALNVSTDLRYFQAVTPCGQSGTVMTSVADLLEKRGAAVPAMAEVSEIFLDKLREEFGFVRPQQKRLLENPVRLIKPKWLKVRAPGSPEYLETREIVKRLKLVTVCEEAQCPNMGECWSHHTATFMVMGEFCTRRCSFCAVKDGGLDNLQPLDPFEPLRVAKAVSELGLEHVVITSVDRDDIEDMGAAHFDRTVRLIKEHNPDTRIELLIPDMRGKRDLVEKILESGKVSVLNHNVETVPRLYKRVRPGANFQRSLDVLTWAKTAWPEMKTKSGLMLGLGERKPEVIETMQELRNAGVDIVTLGQYLQPTPKQLPVDRFVTPEEFSELHEEGMKLGFSHVESGAFVRSSYHAWKHSQPA